MAAVHSSAGQVLPGLGARQGTRRVVRSFQRSRLEISSAGNHPSERRFSKSGCSCCPGFIWPFCRRCWNIRQLLWHRPWQVATLRFFYIQSNENKLFSYIWQLVQMVEGPLVTGNKYHEYWCSVLCFTQCVKNHYPIYSAKSRQEAWKDTANKSWPGYFLSQSLPLPILPSPFLLFLPLLILCW